MRRRPSLSLFGVLAGLTVFTVVSAGCAGKPYKLKEPPSGLVSVESYYGHDRMKGGDDVGVNITSFNNFEGGSLAYWADDMVRKLGRRDYVLRSQRPVTSGNGHEGTRFDFDYTTPADGEAKFFTAILFVTDEWRVVVQVAGDAAHRGAYEGRTAELLEDLDIKGCKIGSKICDAGQPPQLRTGGDGEPSTMPSSDGEGNPTDPPKPEPRPEPEPDPRPVDTPEPQPDPAP